MSPKRLAYVFSSEEAKLLRPYLGLAIDQSKSGEGE